MWLPNGYECCPADRKNKPHFRSHEVIDFEHQCVCAAQPVALMSGTSSTADIGAGQYCRAGAGYLRSHARWICGGRNVATSTQQLRSLRSCASGWIMRFGACRITHRISISSGLSSQRLSAWMLRPRELNQHRQVLHPLREFVPQRLTARQLQLLPRRLRSQSRRRARRRMIR